MANNLTSSALLINESTSYPGTLRNLIARRVNEKSSFSHRFAISPERVDPGNKEWGIANTPRLYAGLTKEAAVETKNFYANFCKNLIEVSSHEVAEAAKPSVVVVVLLRPRGGDICSRFAGTQRARPHAAEAILEQASLSHAVVRQ